MRSEFFKRGITQIILIAGILCLLFAGAFSYCNECSFVSTECSDLWLNVSAIEVEAGSSEYSTFLIHNYGSERFFLDRVYAFDSDSDILTEEISYDNYIKPGEAGEIKVRVFAGQEAEAKNTTAYVEFRGHFLSGKECGYFDSKKGFPVKVSEKKAYSDCGSFELVVPSTVTAEGKERVEFLVSNFSRETAIIRLEGDGLGLSANYFYVPAGVETEKEVLVESALDKAWIEFKVELGGCGIPSKFTEVLSSGYESGVEVNYSKEWTGNSFNVPVTVKNSSQEEKKGIIAMDLPEGWTLEGDGEISVPAESEETFVLEAFPSEGFNEEEEGTLFVSIGGEIKEEEIKFSPGDVTDASLGAAFAALSGGALILGLIVIALVLIALFFLPKNHVPRVDPWERLRKPKQ